jgi:glycosyltransferase involved in cell wall biosynthesis
MSAITSISKASTWRMPPSAGQHGTDRQQERSLVSLVVPAYNEAAIAEKNLSRLCRYMESLEAEYRWELIVINDGSSDATGTVLDGFASTRTNVQVVHHRNNGGVGEAFKSAFELCRGDYVVTLDLDLSYSPDHIPRLLTRMKETGAKVVVASPYMKGGQVSNVPWLRRVLSIGANRFLAGTTKRRLSTLTSMVRAYDAAFLRSVNLRSEGMDINPELVYKAMLLHARVEEIPAHLNWELQKAEGIQRRSSMRVVRHTMAVLVSGFLFRPVIFFICPGLLLLLFALYVNAWVLFHFLTEYQRVSEYTWFFSRASVAVGAAYAQSPHTFIIGLLTSMLAVQILSLGILALQTRSYFEEVFHLGAGMYRLAREGRDSTFPAGRQTEGGLVGLQRGEPSPTSPLL